MARTTLRIDQLLSRFGYCSRREAVAWVRAGRVASAGGAAPFSAEDQRVDPAEALVDGAPVEFPSGLLVALHKPVGCACSHNPEEAPLVYDLLPPRWLRRNPAVITVGRLDRETSGLILVTDDGALAHRLTSPRHEVEKTYEATVSQPFPPGLIEWFASGELMLRGESRPCLPARLEITGELTARLHLHEGKYHQVRRMFASQGCPVTALHRSRVGALELGDLAPGEWRSVSEADISGGA